MTEGKYSCIMEALVAKMPGVARAVLDNSIKKSANEKLDSPSFHVLFVVILRKLITWLTNNYKQVTTNRWNTTSNG